MRCLFVLVLGALRHHAAAHPAAAEDDRSAAALQPATSSREGTSHKLALCSADDDCGAHGLCATEEPEAAGRCMCDLGFSGGECERASEPGTARGGSDADFWASLPLGPLRQGAAAAGSKLGNLFGRLTSGAPPSWLSAYTGPAGVALPGLPPQASLFPAAPMWGAMMRAASGGAPPVKG